MPKEYSDATILALLTNRAAFGLGLRQTVGMGRSIVEMMGLDLKIPCFSTLCRRAAALCVDLGVESREEVRLAMDATGMKVFGEGEWHVRSHGASKRRTWRKLHLSVDVQSGEIVAQIMTENNVGDSEVVEELLQQVEGSIEEVYADGAYDTLKTHERITERSAQPTIPTRRGARIQQHGNQAAEPHSRDMILRAIRKYGRAEWKRRSGYHQRSLVENCIGRLKGIFGDRLQSRCFENEVVELANRCRALNIMSSLGMPDSRLVPT